MGLSWYPRPSPSRASSPEEDGRQEYFLESPVSVLFSVFKSHKLVLSHFRFCSTCLIVRHSKGHIVPFFSLFPISFFYSFLHPSWKGRADDLVKIISNLIKEIVWTCADRRVEVGYTLPSKKSINTHRLIDIPLLIIVIILGMTSDNKVLCSQAEQVISFDSLTITCFDILSPS